MESPTFEKVSLLNSNKKGLDFVCFFKYSKYFNVFAELIDLVNNHPGLPMNHLHCQ